MFVKFILKAAQQLKSLKSESMDQELEKGKGQAWQGLV